MHAISVIISNFNGAKYLPRLIETLRSQRGVELQIIVVDRNSSDESDAILTSNPDIAVVKHPPETGLVSGYHAGTALAIHDLFFFMNEDMWLEPDCLRLVAETINLDDRVAASMPVQWTYDGQDVVNAGIWFTKTWWSRSVHAFRGNAWRLPDRIVDVPAVNAGACLYHRLVYDLLCGWDTSFFLDYEDGDLGLRLWQNKWRGVVVPNALIFHAVGASNSKPINGGTQTVSRKRYIEGGSNILAIAVKTFTGIAVLHPFLGIFDRMIRNLLKRRFKMACWDVLVFGHLMTRVPALLEFRHLNRLLNLERPGQDYYTATEFDIAALANNHREIVPPIPKPVA